MEQTFQALAGILQKAIPTVILLLFLHFYLKAVLFKPLEKVLKERDALTKGARRTAEESLAAADRKTQDYQAKLRDARTELYKEQEEQRRKWLEDQATQVAQAHERASQTLQKAKLQIQAEATVARQNLSQTAGTLADEIAGVMLNGKAGMEAS